MATNTTQNCSHYAAQFPQISVKVIVKVSCVRRLTGNTGHVLLLTQTFPFIEQHVRRTGIHLTLTDLLQNKDKGVL